MDVLCGAEGLSVDLWSTKDLIGAIPSGTVLQAKRDLPMHPFETLENNNPKRRVVTRGGSNDTARFRTGNCRLVYNQ